MNRLNRTTQTMTRWITVVMGVTILLTLVGILLFQAGRMGLSESHVVEDMKARLEQSGADPGDYQYMTSKTDRLYVVLAWQDTQPRNGGYTLYVNRPGFDFGWHFQTSDELGEGVVQAEAEGYGAVWLTFNSDGAIHRVVYGDGTERIVGGYPLVDTASNLHLFDEQGQEIVVLEKPEG